uniref:(northern house mosquito) hypothetical protein n=1 Tax=Culex pipiens TaxID=7175 RepID=A0A8D8F9X8_CULPI
MLMDCFRPDSPLIRLSSNSFAEISLVSKFFLATFHSETLYSYRPMAVNRDIPGSKTRRTSSSSAQSSSLRWSRCRGTLAGCDARHRLRSSPARVCLSSRTREFRGFSVAECLVMASSSSGISKDRAMASFLALVNTCFTYSRVNSCGHLSHFHFVSLL